MSNWWMLSTVNTHIVDILPGVICVQLSTWNTICKLVWHSQTCISALGKNATTFFKFYCTRKNIDISNAWKYRCLAIESVCPSSVSLSCRKKIYFLTRFHITRFFSDFSICILRFNLRYMCVAGQRFRLCIFVFAWLPSTIMLHT